MPDFGIFRGFSDKLFQGQTPTQLGTIGIITVDPLLLDTYPNAAAAYSLRKLRSAYAGSAIRVRRSSDNTEQDIGFSLGNLDTSALTTFCGAGNGFVTTWYDQSGNANNSVQTTATNQPQIVSSGSVITENSKPSILFDGVDDYFLSTSAIEPSFITTANKPIISAANKGIFSADTSISTPNAAIYFNYGSPTRTPQFTRLLSDGSTILAKSSTAVNNNIMNLMSGYKTNTSIQLYINNTSVASGSTSVSLAGLGGTNSGRFLVGSAYYNRLIVDYCNIEISEMIIYTNDQSSNVANINNNINSFYSIY